MVVSLSSLRLYHLDLILAADGLAVGARGRGVANPLVALLAGLDEVEKVIGVACVQGVVAVVVSDRLAAPDEGVIEIRQRVVEVASELIATVPRAGNAVLALGGDEGGGNSRNGENHDVDSVDHFERFLETRGGSERCCCSCAVFCGKIVRCGALIFFFNRNCEPPFIPFKHHPRQPEPSTKVLSLDVNRLAWKTRTDELIPSHPSPFA